MSDKEKIDSWMGRHDGEDYCNYCIYGGECTGATLGPDGPIEPPCTGCDIEDLLDFDAILQDLEDGENEL